MRGPFQNEPGVDCSVPENRAAMRRALEEVGSQLGQTYPLVIGGKRIQRDRYITSLRSAPRDRGRKFP